MSLRLIMVNASISFLARSLKGAKVNKKLENSRFIIGDKCTSSPSDSRRASQQRASEQHGIVAIRKSKALDGNSFELTKQTTSPLPVGSP